MDSEHDIICKNLKGVWHSYNDGKQNAVIGNMSVWFGKQSDCSLKRSDGSLKPSGWPLERSAGSLESSDRPLERSDGSLKQSDRPLKRSEGSLETSDGPLNRPVWSLNQSDWHLERSDRFLNVSDKFFDNRGCIKSKFSPPTPPGGAFRNHNISINERNLWLKIGSKAFEQFPRSIIKFKIIFFQYN